MRIAINLATRPFLELGPLFVRLRIGMGVLALTAIGLGVGAHMLSGRAQAAQQQMDALKARTLAFQTERQSDERRMQQPKNRAVLERSRFLNTLFARKGFSWTAVMMDLERVLPAGVQVTSIEPAVSADGEVSIRLRVSGDRDRAIELVRNLERSQRFLEPHLASESAQTQEGKAVPVAQALPPGAVEFEILSGYNPLPETAAAKAAATPIAPKATHPGASAHPRGATKPRAVAPAAARPAPAGGAR